MEAALTQLSERWRGFIRAESALHSGEPLLKASLLPAFFSIRSDHHLLFRWFVGLEINDPVWDASTFSKDRDCLLEACVAREFLVTLMTLGRYGDCCHRTLPRPMSR